MNNEEKILEMLGQLQGNVEQLQGNVEQLQGNLEQFQAETNAHFNTIDSRLDRIEEDLEQIKEDAAVTRSATNSLVDWADTVGVITQVPFPIKKPVPG